MSFTGILQWLKRCTMLTLQRALIAGVWWWWMMLLFSPLSTPRNKRNSHLVRDRLKIHSPRRLAKGASRWRCPVARFLSFIHHIKAGYSSKQRRIRIAYHVWTVFFYFTGRLGLQIFGCTSSTCQSCRPISLNYTQKEILFFLKCKNRSILYSTHIQCIDYALYMHSFTNGSAHRIFERVHCPLVGNGLPCTPQTWFISLFSTFWHYQR